MPVAVSRKDLYEHVWADPIQKLSKEYGLSDVGLVKSCHRYNIPVPPRGYWAKQQAGKRVSKPSLPTEGRTRVRRHNRQNRQNPCRPPSLLIL